MNLNISSLPNINSYKYNQPFRGTHCNKTCGTHLNYKGTGKTYKASWLILLLASLIALTSCKNNGSGDKSSDSITVSDKEITNSESTIEKTDSGDVMINTLTFGDHTYSKTYYNLNNRLIMHEYNDTNNKVSKERYFKDGSKIHETKMPDGERTIIHDDNRGHIVSTTKYPNGTKLVVEDLHTDKINSITKTWYYRNDSVKSRLHKEETYIGDSLHKKLSFEMYDKQGRLLCWTSNNSNSDTTNAVRDSIGRLIYNKNSNTTYEYNDNDTLPHKEISEKDGCKHIKIFENGEVKSDYFEAKNGIITSVDSLNNFLQEDLK